MFKSEVKRVNGYLREVVTFFDDSGKVISQAVNPLMVELNPRDIMQIFVGSFLIASPLCFTEEVWTLSENLASAKVDVLSAISFLTVSLFVYSNFYRHRLRGNVLEFIKRIFAIYFISLFTVALVLFLIDKLPYETNPQVAINRVIIIGFPAIFGATLSDYIK